MKDLPSYNDDVRAPHFASARRAYFGPQRWGIVEDHPDASSITGLVADSLRAHFPLAHAIPLPADARKALDFLLVAPHSAIDSFLPDQLSSLKVLIAAAPPPLDASWTPLIPSDIRQAVGKLKLSAFLSLKIQCGLGCSGWRLQFIVGFDLLGAPIQSGTSPVDSRTDGKCRVSEKKISASALPRFRERSTSPGRKNGNLIWGEATKQHQSGWLAPPVLIVASAARPKLPLNFAFRFGSDRWGNLRACDDLKRPLTDPS